MARSALLNELRKLGFAGIQCSRTWLAIFNEKYLDDAKKIDKSIFDKMLVSDNQVPTFDQSRFLQIPSIKAEVKNQSLNSIDFKRILNSESISENDKEKLKYLMLSDLYGSFKQIENHKNGVTALRAFISRLGLNELMQIPSLLNLTSLPSPERTKKVNQILHKILTQIPTAESFFSLFDVFDIATIDRPEMKEKITFKMMNSGVLKYQELLASTDLKKIKTATEFSQQLQKAFNLNFDVRDYEVVMTPHQKGKNSIKLTGLGLQDLQKNPFLTVDLVNKSYQRTADMLPTEADVSYFNLSQIPRIQHLLSSFELGNINRTLESGKTKAQRSAALKMAQTFLLEKFFDPKEFRNLSRAFGANESDPYSLYRAFVSLHPYKDGNGRAARLYYRWLVVNHFPDRSPILKILINDNDLLQKSVNPDEELTWNLTRLWIAEVSSEQELIQRARSAIQTESKHSYVLNHSLLDQADLIMSLGPIH